MSESMEPATDIDARMQQQQAERRRLESKALVAWSNAFLNKRKMTATELQNDFADGVLLVNLLETCFQTKVGKYNMAPRLPFHKLENVTLCTDWIIKNLGIQLVGIDSNDIVNKKEKQTINVLWSILRGLALRGIVGDDGKPGQAGKMRENLLKWANDLLEGSGIEIKDFWDSFKDGIALCAIVENLCPGSIDVPSLSAENSIDNLNLAFSTAEAKLGIPPLLQAEDITNGKKPDEKSLMNYVCMLVSVSKGLQENKSKMQKLKEAAEEEKRRKAEELEAVKAELELKMKEEQELAIKQKEAMEAEIQATMAQFKQMQEEMEKTQSAHQTASETASTFEEKLKEEKALRVEDSKAFESTIHALQVKLVEEQTKLMANFDKERHGFRDQLAQLNEEKNSEEERLKAIIAQLEKDKSDLEDQLTDVTSQLYTAHKDREDMNNNFRAQMTNRAYQERKVQNEQEQADALSKMLQEGINAQKSSRDFIFSLPDKSGWLVRKRPDNKIMRSSEKRFFQLKGDTLSWSKSAADAADKKREKACNLLKYLMIDRSGLTDANKPDEGLAKKRESVSMKVPGGGRMQRRASVMTFSKRGAAVVQLVPRDPAKDSTLQLSAVPLHEAEHSEDLMQWVDSVNTRIALLRYLEGGFNQSTLARGGREMIAFICNLNETDLRIENKVVDLFAALNHFKEPLSHRKNLSLIFNNVACGDSEVNVIAEILEMNKEGVLKLSLRQNMISSDGVQRLAKALKKNKSLTELNLDMNQVKDEGLLALAESMYYHRNLSKLTLNGCQIADHGVTYLCKAMLDSQKKFGTPHTFPVFDMSNNFITDKGVKAIARFMRTNGTVESLILNSNLITDKGVGYIVDTITGQENPLKEIYLADCQISNKGAQRLVPILKSDERELFLDLSMNKLVSREGLKTLLGAEVPLEFRQLFIVKKNTSEGDDEGSLSGAPPAQNLLSPAAKNADPDSKLFVEGESAELDLPEPEPQPESNEDDKFAKVDDNPLATHEEETQNTEEDEEIVEKDDEADADVQAEAEAEADADKEAEVDAVADEAVDEVAESKEEVQPGEEVDEEAQTASEDAAAAQIIEREEF